MSEIIFPSEIVIPAEIDWENPIANALVSAGVGIFFTDDNLTTVTNVADGSVGTSTDITNNELGVVSNGYRMGAVITGLTSEQQTSVTDNPYQLFKTAETVEDEYGLKLTTGSESISIPFVGAYDINLTDSADAVTNYTGTGTFTLNGTTAVFIKLVTGTHDGGYEIFEFNQTSGTSVTSHASALVCTIAGVANGFNIIVPKEIFHIKADGTQDYTTVAVWYSAHNNANSHYELHLYDMQTGGFTTSGSAITKGITFKAAAGLDPSNSLAQVGFTGVLFNTSGGFNSYVDIGAQQLKIFGTSSVIDGVVIDGLNSTSIDGIVPNSGTVHVRNSIIRDCNDGVYNNKIPAGDMVIADSLVINSNRYASVTATFINTIFRSNTNDPLASTVSYSLTDKSSLSGTGNQSSIDFTGAFVDEGNDDFRVNQAWADTNLVGKGWNGSDICKWAYYSQAVLPFKPIWAFQANKLIGGM